MDNKRNPEWVPPKIEVKVDSIPEMLRGLDRWILWNWEWREGRNGKSGSWTKVPRQASGSHAASNDPNTWTSFDEAVDAYRIQGFSGLGITLPKMTTGVDLDDCRTGRGKPLTEESKTVLSMMRTYAEWSPSGTGVKLIAGGQLSDKLKKIDGRRGVEMYDGGLTNRYFTITGDVVDSSHTEITDQRVGLDLLQGFISDPIANNQPDEDYVPEAGDVKTALECLDYLKDDFFEPYEMWSAVGMALKSVCPSDEMLNAWISWSSQGSTFDGDEVCRKKWESFRRQSGRLITLHWLKRQAIEYGYHPDKYRTKAVNAADLYAANIQRTYLIEDVLVEGEPGCVGGSSKSLKTTVAFDMAVSIATGRPFLGKFKVPEAKKVLFISGESGEKTLQETLINIAEEKGIQSRDLKNLEIGFKLPKLDDGLQVADLIEELKDRGISVLFIDPLYRSLRAGEGASNIYLMGERLEQIAEQLARADITVVLLHHFKKVGRTYTEPPELEDLSQSGLAEFVRQFVLLKRYSEYQHDGVHELWMIYGGSAGHQGMGVLKAITGTRKAGLTWKPELMKVSDVEAAKKEQKEQEKQLAEMGLETKLVEILVDHMELSMSKLQDIAGGRKSSVKTAIERLVHRGGVIETAGPRSARLFSLSEDALKGVEDVDEDTC